MIHPGIHPIPGTDRVTLDASLVRDLVADQFPHWAGLPVTPVVQGGWDNQTFHLGDRMSVRLPSAAGYVPQIGKEHRWLPWLAPRLPLPVPAPIAKGEPALGYDWPWSIYGWIDGTPANRAPIADTVAFAHDVASFLHALQQLDASGGPAAGAHSFHRGGGLRVYDGDSRRAIANLPDGLDRTAAASVWDTALAAPFAGPPVWVHGDIAPGNMLVRDGKLAAVLDFGCSAVGDPACDLVLCWTFLEGDARDAFRAQWNDPALWARARGWAIWKAMIIVALGNRSNAPETLRSTETFHAVIEDFRRYG
jgi:aminoglycoside phosphotransferase (APT) family kinase protein